jgi:hypothetical protein
LLKLSKTLQWVRRVRIAESARGGAEMGRRGQRAVCMRSGERELKGKVSHAHVGISARVRSGARGRRRRAHPMRGETVLSAGRWTNWIDGGANANGVSRRRICITLGRVDYGRAVAANIPES